jgi:ribosome-binding protein aMBF1 (putative translation factor)
MIELQTPKSIIEDLIEVIENERKFQGIQQKELALKASMPLPTYKAFVYKKIISLENLLKILFALKMFDNISGLLKKRTFASIEEIENKNKLPKRIRK